MSAQKRRDVRYKVQLRATVIRGKETCTLLTEDVSYRGVFLRTEDPPKLRQLAQVKMRLPPDKAEVNMHAMAVHVVPADNTWGRTPGVGFQFFAQEGPDKARWDQFIRWLKEQHPASETRPVGFVSEETRDLVRKAQPRYEQKIRIWAKSMEQLYHLYTQTQSEEGLLLATPQPLPLGATLNIVLMHPENGQSFAITGLVRKQVERETFRGVAVELFNMSAERKAAFLDFVSDDIDISVEDALA